MKQYFFSISSILILILYGTAFSQVPNEFYYVNALKSSSNSDVVKVIQDEYTGDFIVAGTYRGQIQLDPTTTAPTHTGSGKFSILYCQI